MPNALTAADLHAVFDAFNRHDIDGVMQLFADDCIFYAVGGEEAYGTKIAGAEAIAKAFVGVWSAMPDAQWGNHSHFVSGDRAVSEWLFYGTDSSGMRIEAMGADLFTHREGKIINKQAFRKSRPMFKAPQT